MTTTLQPTSAQSSSWTNPTNALAFDGSVAEQSAGGSAAWLRLTGFGPGDIEPNDVLDAGTVRVRLGAYVHATGQFGMVSTAYADNIGAVSGNHTEVYDGNNATGFGADDAYTVIHDLGAAQAVASVRLRFFSEAGSYQYKLSYSSDGTAWTDVSFVVPAPSPSQTVDQVVTVGVTARYWRWTQSELGGPGSLPESAKCFEFVLRDAGGSPLSPSIIVPSGLERVQVAWTVDGASPIGRIATAAIGASAQWVEFDIESDFGVMIAANMLGDDYGVLVRRADVLGGEATETVRRVDCAEIIWTWTPSLGSQMALPRIFAEQRSIIGLESTPGTIVAPTINLQATRFDMQPAETESETKFMSDLVGHAATALEEIANGALSGKLTYDELGLVLASVFGKPVTTTVAAGVYEHEFWIDTHYGTVDPRTYTHRKGDANLNEYNLFTLVTGMSFEMSSSSDLPLNGTVVGRKVVEGNSGLPAGAAQVWTLNLNGYTGNFQLGFKGGRTAVLNATGLNAGAIQSALQAVGTIGASGMTVTGTGPFVITAGGGITGKLQPNIDVVGSATPTVAITTAGGFTEFECVPIGKQDVKVFYGATVADLGNSSYKIGELHSFGFNLANRYSIYPVIDSDTTSFKGFGASSDMELTGEIMVSADANGQAMAADAASKVTKWMRFHAVSPKLVAAGYPYELKMDIAVRLTPRRPFSQNGTVYARSFGWKAQFSQSEGRAIKVVLRNKVASY